MTPEQPIYSDRTYQVMAHIATNEQTTQREISKALGISVGSINVLMNKLVKEGLVKMEQVSAKQVLYMLTPRGVIEKAKKTASYLQVHYHAIYTTKEKIKEELKVLLAVHSRIYILIGTDEVGEILRLATEEYSRDYPAAPFTYITDTTQQVADGIIVHMGESHEWLEEVESGLGITSMDMMMYL